MKIHLTNNNPFIFVGDIHGEFEPFTYNIINKLKLINYNIIICGDFGMGFHKTNYYNTTFRKIQKKLNKNNIHFYAFRGNHDDPDYFSNPELIDKVLNGVKNIHLVNDYDIIKNEKHTIVCIGGARSIDKCNRWKWDKITQKQKPNGWWEGEQIKNIPEDFFKFLNENDIKIDVICSHSSPDFCEPFTKDGLQYWAKFDDTLIEDCDNERRLLTTLYHLIKKQNEIKYYFYGHFHNHYYNIIDGVLFRGLNMFDESVKNDFFILDDSFI